jgi:hypothetical protein
MLFAGLVLGKDPILLVFLAPQKHLVKGITAGAMKGGRSGVGKVSSTSARDSGYVAGDAISR